jgi:predicted transcriptional regulator YheO
MLVDIDSKNNNEYIIEELDEEHILVKETKVNEIKSRLNMVRVCVWRLVGRLTDMHGADDERETQGARELGFGVD